MDPEAWFLVSLSALLNDGNSCSREVTNHTFTQELQGWRGGGSVRSPTGPESAPSKQREGSQPAVIGYNSLLGCPSVHVDKALIHKIHKQIKFKKKKIFRAGVWMDRAFA